MTRRGFDSELNSLLGEILCMGNEVEKQISSSVKALIDQDTDLADEVIKNDDIIDKYEWDIEDRCVKLIATEQPMAIDLRTIIAATKIATDLERMADHAVDIAKISKRLKNEVYIKELVDIPRVSRILSVMIKDALDAYIEKDVEKAYAVCKMDDEIDSIYQCVFTEMMPIMSREPSTITQITQFMFVCKFLERAGDHVTNICEWIIYLVTGEQKDLNE